MSKQPELIDISRLLPCPFCGAAVEIKKHPTHDLRAIQCNTKGCISPCVTDATSKSLSHNGAIKEMVRRWNTRKGQPLESAVAVDTFPPQAESVAVSK